MKRFTMIILAFMGTAFTVPFLVKVSTTSKKGRSKAQKRPASLRDKGSLDQFTQEGSLSSARRAEASTITESVSKRVLALWLGSVRQP